MYSVYGLQHTVVRHTVVRHTVATVARSVKSSSSRKPNTEYCKP